jgi:hypothetical protein
VLEYGDEIEQLAPKLAAGTDATESASAPRGRLRWDGRSHTTADEALAVSGPGQAALAAGLDTVGWHPLIEMAAPAGTRRP